MTDTDLPGKPDYEAARTKARNQRAGVFALTEQDLDEIEEAWSAGLTSSRAWADLAQRQVRRLLNEVYRLRGLT
jgi:hypothetical protein